MHSIHLSRHIGMIAISLGLLSNLGCANLTVRKVPVEERIAGTDRQEGFRYYLNRPYLIVKEPITVSERKILVHVDPANLKKAELAPAPAEKTQELKLTILDGPQLGQTIHLSELQVETPGSGSFRRVSPEELKKVAEKLMQGTDTDSSDVSPVAFRGPQGAPAAPTIIVENPPPSIDPNFLREAIKGASPGVPLAATFAVSDQKLMTPSDQTDAPALQGKMEIVFLPDLDEQYAIRSKNVFAKSSFALGFRNGTELAEVQGNHDSTTVALKLFDLLSGAIETAGGVEQQRIIQQRNTLRAGGGAAPFDLGAEIRDNKHMIWQIVQRTSIKPGVYRLNKPWEMEGAELHPIGCGLLAKLGLPTITEIVDFTRMETLTPQAASKE